MSVGKPQILAWLERLQSVYSENRQLLTDLDSAIGDADHGINMDRGFTAVRAALDSNDSSQIQVILQAVATTLIRTVGGHPGRSTGPSSCVLRHPAPASKNSRKQTS